MADAVRHGDTFCMLRSTTESAVGRKRFGAGDLMSAPDGPASRDIRASQPCPVTAPGSEASVEVTPHILPRQRSRRHGTPAKDATAVAYQQRSRVPATIIDTTSHHYRRKYRPRPPAVRPEIANRRSRPRLSWRKAFVITPCFWRDCDLA